MSRTVSPQRQGVTALLDPGSTKISCALVAADGSVLGFAQVPSSGIQAGMVVVPALAHGSIAKAVVEAERLAGVCADRAIIAVNAGAFALHHVTADAALDPPIVTPAALARLAQGLDDHGRRNGRIVIHREAPRYRLDERPSAMPPLERFGRRLAMTIDQVTTDATTLDRMLAAVAATGLRVAQVVPASLAAAVAVTTEPERNGAIAVVDIGAELTTVTTYAGGRPRLATAISIGAAHVARDAAARLPVNQTNPARITSEHDMSLIAHADAAQILGLSGSCRPTPEMTGSGAAAPPHVGAPATDATILERLLRLIADRLDSPAATLTASSPVVLTGGGSRLAGLIGVTEWLWDRRVRAGLPLRPDLQDAGWGPETAVVAGLMDAERLRLGLPWASATAPGAQSDIEWRRSVA